MQHSISQAEIDRRWPTAHDFYGERDNRTKLELAELDSYSSRPIEIWIDPAESSSAIQQTALVACNLTARWARNIQVRMSPEVVLADNLQRNGHHLLGDRIISEMRGGDPFGNFHTASFDQPSSALKPLRLFIGSWNNESRIAEEDYIITPLDRFAIGSRGKGISNERAGENALTTAAAGLAASLGVADLFKRAVEHDRANWLPDFCWDLWNQKLMKEAEYRNLPAQEFSGAIGRVLIAGVGAIGSSLIYLLDLADVRGDLCVLDRDQVETSNLNRSLMFEAWHVLAELRKTEITARFLRDRKLSVQRLDGTWHEHGPAIARERLDIWISFTNEDGAWAEVPFQLPPVVLQGTTTSGWGFGAGRHIPRAEDCTLCRMPRPESIFRGPCAEGEINPDETKPPARASLPFLSAASASLVLAELIKINTGDVRSLPNDVSADLRTGLPAVMRLSRRRTADCRGCTFLQSKTWEAFGGRGRFRHLSSQIVLP